MLAMVWYVPLMDDHNSRGEKETSKVLLWLVDAL
jgi:hypothetical protein